MADKKPEGWLGNGNATACGYVIEARAQQAATERFGMVIGTEWTQIPTRRVTPGEGITNDIADPLAERHGFLTYSAAMAMMATCASASRFGVEFRLVKREIAYSYNLREIGVGPAITFDYTEERAIKFEPRPAREVPSDA